MLRPLLLAVLTAFLLMPFLTQASHIAGGHFEYRCLGNDGYEITLHLIRDCSGVGAPTSANVNFVSTCGGNFNATLDLNASDYLDCPSNFSNSVCDTGTLVGFQMYHYVDTVQLAPVCSTGSWTMSFSTCCLSSGYININNSSSVGLYISATVNVVNAPCNSSPVLSTSYDNHPVHLVCQSQDMDLNIGAYDPDGDKMRYELDPNPLGFFTNINYFNISMDTLTGQWAWTGTPTIGLYLLAYNVTHYDTAGLPLGTIRVVTRVNNIPCSNPSSGPGAGSVSNVSNPGSQTAPNQFELCVGESVCFDITFQDSVDTAGAIQVMSNVTEVLPGATITSTGTNPVTAQVCWTAVPMPGECHNFYVGGDTRWCTPGAYSSQHFTVIVHGGVEAEGDTTLCLGQEANLSATGSDSLTWSVISGSPITVGNNFSCNPCLTPIAAPSVTTTYEVSGLVSNGCQSIDTVTVTVVPDFPLQVLGSDSLCDGDSTTLSAVPGLAGSYSFSWWPTLGIDTPSAQSPVAIPPVTTEYEATVASASGCVKKDSVTVYVSNPVDLVQIASSDTLFCVGDSVELMVLPQPIPPCSSFPYPLNGVNSVATVGTGTSLNGTTTYPAAFGAGFRTVRQQYLFRASELLAAGVQPGLISGLEFSVVSNSSNPVYQHFTVSIGCTSDNVLTTNWLGGLNQAFDPQTITVTTGWNTLTFNQPYAWDGTSNLVIETCFKNDNVSTNALSTYTPTNYASALYFRTNSTLVGACNSNLVTALSAQRPNTRFIQTVYDVAGYGYNWGLSSNPVYGTAQNSGTVAALPGSNTYTVVVEDLAFGCLDTGSIALTGASTFSTNVSTTPATCGVGNGAITITTTGGSGPFSFENLGTGVAQNNGSFSPLPPGTYNYLVSDAAGCTQSVSTTVVNIGGISLDSVQTVDGVCGNLNGSATLFATSAFGPITYTANSIAQTNPTFSNLGPGGYNATATDSTGCQANIFFSIADVDLLSLDSVSVTNVTCHGDSNGAIQIGATSQGGNLVYSIDNGLNVQSSPLFSGLTPGIYHLEVDNGLNCFENTSVVVSGPQPVLLALSPDTFLGCLGDQAVLNASVSGGNGAPYAINWPGQGSGSSITVSPITPTWYPVQATDSIGCTSDLDSIFVDAPDSLSVSISNDTTILQGQIATLCATPITGVAPYTYLWSTGESADCIFPMPSSSGTYAVTVTDDCGQSEVLQVFVQIDSTTSIAPSVTQFDLKVFPNPSPGLFQLNASFPDGAPVSLQVIDALGRQVGSHQLTWSNGFELDLRGQARGVYFLRVEHAGLLKTIRLVKH